MRNRASNQLSQLVQHTLKQKHEKTKHPNRIYHLGTAGVLPVAMAKSTTPGKHAF